MMFLLRAAFWVGLVLVLLPTGSKKQTIEGPQVNVADAATAATAAVADMSQFCSRRPDTCAIGSRIATMLGHRAKAGAAMVYDFVAQRGEPDAKKNGTPTRDSPVAEQRAAEGVDTTGSIRRMLSHVVPAALLQRSRPTQSQDTLSSSDRQSAWRAPVVQETQIAATAH
jgi:hypothetical protein